MRERKLSIVSSLVLFGAVLTGCLDQPLNMPTIGKKVSIKVTMSEPKTKSGEAPSDTFQLKLPFECHDSLDVQTELIIEPYVGMYDPADTIETKGSIHTEIPSTIYIYATPHDEENGYIYASPSVAYNMTATKSGSNYIPSTTLYWPSSGRMSFFAYAGGGSASSNEHANGAPYISHTVSASVADQEDLLCGIALNGSSGTANIPFYHALSAVSFNFTADFACTLKSVTVSGLNNEGLYRVGGEWSSQAGSASWAQTIDSPVSENGTYYAFSGSNTLLMIPQTCPSDARVTVVFESNGLEYSTSVSLAGQNWIRGNQYTYTLRYLDRVLSYGAPEISLAYGGFTAAGGTSEPTMAYSQLVTYVSGRTTTLTSGASVSYGGSASGFSLDGTTGVLTAEANQGSGRSIDVTATVTLNGQTGTKTVTVAQNGDSISSYDVPSVSVGYDNFGAEGGTHNPSISYSQVVHYVSGRTTTQTTGGSVSYSGSATGFTLNASSGALTAVPNEGDARGISVTASVTMNGQTGSGYTSVYQNGDSISSYDVPSVSVSYSNFGAAADTHYPSVSYSQTVHYVSGKTTTLTSGGSVSYGGSADGFSLNGTDGSLYAAANTGSQRSIAVTCYVSLNGQTGSGSTTVYQDADSISGYGTPSVSVGYSNFGPAADTHWPSVSYSQTVYYVSGRTTTATSGASSVTYGGSASGFSLNSSDGSLYAAANTGGARGITVTCYVTLNGQSGSGSTYVTQGEDYVVQDPYNPRVYAWGTPSGSIGSGMSAGGGSATLSASVTDTWISSRLMASGAVYDNSTYTLTGSVSYGEVYDNNNAYSYSGWTIYHRNMDKSVTTDGVTVRFYNANDNSKYVDSYVEYTNSYSDSWGDKQYGDPYYGDKSYGDVYNGDKSYGDVYNGDKSYGGVYNGSKSYGDLYGSKSYGDVYNGSKSYGNVYNGSTSYGDVYNGDKSYGSVYNGTQSDNWYVGDKEYGSYWWGDWYDNGDAYDVGSATHYDTGYSAKSYGSASSSTSYTLVTRNTSRTVAKAGVKETIGEFMASYGGYTCNYITTTVTPWSRTVYYYYYIGRAQPTRRDQYRSWTRYNYNNWSYARYRDWSMPRYRPWSYPRYRDWSLPRYRDYSMARYHDYSLPRYHDFSMPRYRNYSMPRYRNYSVGRYRSWNRYGTRYYTSGATDALSDSGSWEYLDTQYGTDYYDTVYGTDQYDTQYGTDYYDTQYGTDYYDTVYGTDQYDTQYGTEQYDTQSGTDYYDTQYGTDYYDTQSGTSQGSAYDSGNDWTNYETSTRDPGVRYYNTSATENGSDSSTSSGDGTPTLTSSVNWIRVSVTVGVTISNNLGGANRTGTVTATYGDKSLTLTVVQSYINIIGPDLPF